MRSLHDSFAVLRDYADPRLNDYFLMSSPLPVLGILTFYLLLVLKIGPLYMKNRPPFQMSTVIQAYNVLQIVVNAALWLLTLREWSRMSVLCNPVDRSNSPDAITTLNLHYCYFLLKLLDLLDTGFFVLRKKYEQMTFLHLYHHTLMVGVTWVSCKYMNGGPAYYLGVINLFVHVVMYVYYFLAAGSSQYAKNVWWKKYLTQLQLVQHFLLFFVFLLPYLNPNCNYPKGALVFYLTQSVMMIVLFSNFYIKTYLMGKKKLK